MHLMIERMSDNDAIVTRYLEDEAFQSAALPYLGKAIFDTIMREPKDR